MKLMLDMVVRSVREVGEDAWNSVRAPGRRDLSSKAANSIELDPFLWLVAFDASGPVARLRCRRDETQVRIGTPVVGDRAGPELAAQAMRALLLEAESRLATHANVSKLEAKPDDGTGLRRGWVSILVDEGFTEIAAAQIYVRSTEPVEDVLHPAILSIHDETNLPQRRFLEQSLVEVRGNTFDRIDRIATDANEILLQLEAAAGQGALWTVAEAANDCVVGYALVAPSINGGDGELAAWLIDIGVIPSWRRQGIGRLLLLRTILRAHEAGAAILKSLIDERNTPSICLHLGLGFIRRATRYLTLEKFV